MHLTRYTDYSLRLLMLLGLRSEKSMTIQEVSDLYQVSRNHLVKIVNHLASLNLIETTRGRNGGIRLSANPEEVVVGEVVRAVEPSLQLVECFDEPTNRCLISAFCGFKPILYEAQRSFFEVLDQYTLADLLNRPRELAGVFAAREAEQMMEGEPLRHQGARRSMDQPASSDGPAVESPSSMAV